jgi:hypothetical protein
MVLPGSVRIAETKTAMETSSEKNRCIYPGSPQKLHRPSAPMAPTQLSSRQSFRSSHPGSLDSVA